MVVIVAGVVVVVVVVVAAVVVVPPHKLFATMENNGVHVAVVVALIPVKRLFYY